MSPETVKRALARLARDPPERAPTVIEAATAATGDVSDAADFVDRVGVDRLSVAVATARRTDPELARRGERTLAAYREFREAATSSGRE